MIELDFQKELVKSAQGLGWLSDTVTHRFKRGWPDVMWKPKSHHNHDPAAIMPIFTECKYVDLNSKGKGRVPVETTELQKLCLHAIRNSGMLACVTVFVTVDKKSPVVYYLYDIDTEEFNHFDNDLPKYSPTGREKGKNVWPLVQMTNLILMNHRLNSSTEKSV